MARENPTGKGVSPLRGLSLADARAWLAGLGYREDMTNGDVIALVANRPDAEIQRTIAALRISGAALHHEAEGLRATAASRGGAP